MTALNTVRPVATTGRISNIFVVALSTIVAWNDQRITRKSLGKLTDRELDDIGLVRGDIESL